MKPTQAIIDIVNRVPDLDTHGTVHGVPWEESTPVYDEILSKGRDGILQVVGMLVEVDDGTDYKPRYLLHGIAVYLCRPGKEKVRETFCKTLASEFGGELNKTVQGYLIRQLQVAGGAEVVESLGQLLDEDNWDYAAQALLAIGGGEKQFRDAFKLALEKGMTAQLLTAAHALGVLRDNPSADALRSALDHEGDPDIPLVAAWGLANMGDANSADAVLAYADSQAAGWLRTRATSHCLLLAENVEDKEVARKIYRHLEKNRDAPEEDYLRDVAKDLLATL